MTIVLICSNRRVCINYSFRLTVVLVVSTMILFYHINVAQLFALAPTWCFADVINVIDFCSISNEPKYLAINDRPRPGMGNKTRTMSPGLKF